MLPFLHIFSVRVPAYALFVALGALAALSLFFLHLPRPQRKAAAIFVLLTALGALAGAKALYLATMPRDTPLSDALLYGFVFHGGLLGGALTGIAAARRLRLDALALSDRAAPCVAIGHGIGRVGCFCAGCCYGISVPWGLVMPQALGAPRDVPLLPVQLIEAACNLLLGLFLLRYSANAKRPREPGYAAALYCLLYGALRFALEYLRGDLVRGFAAGLSTGQWMSLLLALAGLLLLARVSTAELTLHGARLTLALRPLSFPIPIRVRIALKRDAANHLRLYIQDRRARPSQSSRYFNSSVLLRTLGFPRVRALTVHAVLRVPDDAAATAQLCGLARAALSALCAQIRVLQGDNAALHYTVLPSFGRTRCSLDARVALSLPTASIVKALWRGFRARAKRARTAAT